MAVEQRETYQRLIDSGWRIRECRHSKQIEPVAFVSEIGRTALRCSEIALDAGERGYDSWQIAAEIRKAFGLE